MYLTASGARARALSHAFEALQLVSHVDDRFNCRNQECTERCEPILYSWGEIGFTSRSTTPSLSSFRNIVALTRYDLKTQACLVC